MPTVRIDGADPARDSGGNGNFARPLRWLVGIITAPRRSPTILPTYRSILAAGWLPAETIISYEPGALPPVQITDQSRCYGHVPPAGCWRNWRACLARLLDIADDCGNDGQPIGRLLISEDDCLYSHGLRHYLDRIAAAGQFPLDGVASLYTAAPNDRCESPGWNPIRVPLRSYGALAYSFPPELGRRILADPPFDDRPHGTDTAVGYFCHREKIPYYCHSPSFVMHTGGTEVSSENPVGDSLSTLPPAGLEKNRQCAEWLESADGFRVNRIPSSGVPT